MYQILMKSGLYGSCFLINSMASCSLFTFTIGGSSIDFPPIFLDIALHYNKEDLNKKDHLGNLPLHLACGRINIQYPDAVCDGTVAKKILSVCPQAAYKPARQTKRLAIHIAVESQKPLSLISSLIISHSNISARVFCSWVEMFVLVISIALTSKVFNQQYQ